MNSREPRKAKGSVLEDIVAALHAVHGFDAAVRVRLPSLNDPSRRREVDVLLTVNAAPYVLKVAIECKNRGRPVTVGEIGDFRDKLDDVGLNVRGAIFVSAVGFQDGAKSRAEALGILPMILSGLTPDKMRQAASKALNGTLFLLPEIRQVTYKSNHTTGDSALRNPDGEFGGMIMDLAWKHWIELRQPRLGAYANEELVPTGWGSYIDGDFASVESISFELNIVGHLLLRQGVVMNASLSLPDEKIPRLMHVQAKFESPYGAFNLVRVESEAELARLINREAALLVALARVKVPRLSIRDDLNESPWPPDDDEVIQLWESYRDQMRQGKTQFDRIQFTPGSSDIGRLFEAPSAMYMDGLKSKLGSTWNKAIWSAFA